jgi:hypothetical protein
MDNRHMEKMLNISNHQENVNQNHHELSLVPGETLGESEMKWSDYISL